MKTKELTIDVLEMRHEESKLADRGLAQLIVEANFETLPDFQEFMRLAGDAYLLGEEAFNRSVQSLKSSLEGMYSCIKKTGDGVKLDDYDLAANQQHGRDKEGKKRHNLLRRVYDSLDSYESFKGWYESYNLELQRQSIGDIRGQAQLDSIVIINNGNRLKLGDVVKFAELTNSSDTVRQSQERFDQIKSILLDKPFFMNERDAIFILNYINQQNFIANTALPLLGYGRSAGGMFVQGKWDVQEDISVPRSIELVIDDSGRLNSIETKSGQSIRLGKQNHCRITHTEQMTLAAGTVTGRKSTITSDKPFTVPDELLAQGLEAHSTFIKELGIFEQVKQYLADSVKLIVNKLKEFYEKTKAPKKKQLILSSEMDKVEGSKLMPSSRVSKFQETNTAQESRRTKHRKSNGASRP